jgi:hypothetical protein
VGLIRALHDGACRFAGGVSHAQAVPSSRLEEALIPGLAGVSAGVLEVVTGLVVHAFGAFFEAFLRDLPDGLRFAVAFRKPLGKEVALGEPFANDALVAGAAGHRQAPKHPKPEGAPHQKLHLTLAAPPR